MSIILDALKKLDREKSSRRNRTANIAVEILKPEPPRPEKRILRPVAAAALTAVVTAAATYAVVHFGFFPKPTIPGPVNPPAPGQQVAPAPEPRDSLGDARGETKRPPTEIQVSGEGKNPVAPSGPPDQGPAGAKPASPRVAPSPVFREPVGSPRSETTRAPSKIQDPGERKTPAPPSPPPAQGSVDARQAGEQPVPAPGLREPVGDIQGMKAAAPPKAQSPGEDKSVRPPVPPPVQGPTDTKLSSQQAPSSFVSREPVPGQTSKGLGGAPPSMKLSGIVWSSEPSERMAVINSQVVKEGGTIEGAKVVEIGPTRVRLVHNGTPFEISIHLFGK
jgi:general secretion pathway protein B